MYARNAIWLQISWDNTQEQQHLLDADADIYTLTSISQVIWLRHDFFWSKVWGLLGKTPYIYLNFDFAYYHPPLLNCEF